MKREKFTSLNNFTNSQLITLRVEFANFHKYKVENRKYFFDLLYNVNSESDISLIEEANLYAFGQPIQDDCHSFDSEQDHLIKQLDESGFNMKTIRKALEEIKTNRNSRKE